MWFLQRLLQILWAAMKPNEEVPCEADIIRSLINGMCKRKATFFGHMMRREELEHLVTTGMMKGKYSKGKQ